MSKKRIHPTLLGDLIRKVCRLLKEKGTKEEFDEYINYIKLDASECSCCKEITPTIECENFKICALCEVGKK